jgi:hypothetical protein
MKHTTVRTEPDACSSVGFAISMVDVGGVCITKENRYIGTTRKDKLEMRRSLKITYKA